MNSIQVNPRDPASWRCTALLSPPEHRALCQTMALDGFKWDGQVGDETTLAAFAVVVPRSTWHELEWMAEALAAELAACESELMARPELWRELGLPPRVCAALHGSEPWTPAAARVVRFDFHPTVEGWRVSEANSDVPGGYAESTQFSRLMAAHADGAAPIGDPTAALADALLAQVNGSGLVALLAAPGYIEDLQVVTHLSAALRERGADVCRVRPEQLEWRAGVAQVLSARGTEPIDAIFRFYQGEWMPRVSGEDWRFLLRGGRTPVCNPAAAILSESKRLPVLWRELDTAMPTWRKLVPSTAPVLSSWTLKGRVLKRSYSNNGDAVLSRRWSRTRDYALALAHGIVAPTQWSAQQTFDSLQVATPAGHMHPCLGVYVVNGRACGIYGRLAARPPIDFRAIDTAILVEDQ